MCGFDTLCLRHWEWSRKCKDWEIVGEIHIYYIIGRVCVYVYGKRGERLRKFVCMWRGREGEREMDKMVNGKTKEKESDDENIEGGDNFIYGNELCY